MPDPLGEGLTRLLDDGEMRECAAGDARDRFAAVFTVERVARAMMGVYAEAVARRGLDDSVGRKLCLESEGASSSEGDASAP
jgi:hypothetical protein